MSSLQDLLANSEQPNAATFPITSKARRADATGKPQTSVQNDTGIENTTMASAPLNTLKDVEVRAQYEEAIASNLPKTPKEMSPELTDFLAETVELNGVLNYKHPRYFAQTAGRQGMVVYIPDADKSGQRNISIEFEKGIYTTTNIQIADAISTAISRRQGVGAYIREITKGHYAEMLDKANRWAQLQGSSTVFNTTNASPDKGLGVQAIADENEKLKQQLAEMKTQMEQATQAAKAKKPDLALFGNP